MVNFGKFSSENTVIFDDFSPKMTKVRPKYVSWGSIQDGVAITRIRYTAYFFTLESRIYVRPFHGKGIPCNRENPFYVKGDHYFYNRFSL